MKISQKRAIYYSIRKRKLNKIGSLGLMNEYKAFRGDSNYHKIERFCQKKGIVL